MALVAALVLRVFHYFYSLIIICCSFCARSPPSAPQSSRHRIPKHIALLLVSGTTEDHSDLRATLVQTVVDAVSWCCASGIQKLTVYEEHGTTPT